MLKSLKDKIYKFLHDLPKKICTCLFKETCKLRCRTSGVSIEQNHKIGSEELCYRKKTSISKTVGKLI